MQLFKSKSEKTLEFLEELGTKNIRHSRGSLFDHLVRVKDILTYWGCDEDTQYAGLCHSLYSTEYFKNQVLDVANRTKLQSLIGESAEKIVFLFSQLDRSNIEFVPEERRFVLYSFTTQEKLEATYDDAVSIIHIMLANDIDHIGPSGIGLLLNNYRKYTHIKDVLVPKANAELTKIIGEPDTWSKDGVLVRFIAHSGVQMANKTSSLVIDPWLFDSQRDQPHVRGLDPTQYTIDYLIPEPKNNIKDLTPDVVCLSHLHTHHSPLNEIVEFAKIKPIIVICPILSQQKLTLLKEKIGNYIFDRIQFIFIEKDEEITIHGFHIKAMIHRPSPLPHIMFYVTLQSTSIMHIVDARVQPDESPLTNYSFSPQWVRVKNLTPDFLFIGAAGHLRKSIRNGVRHISCGTFSPLEAAQLAVRIMPKKVSVVGIYNHSVWDDRYELGLSASEAENQFYWCLSYLAPSIQFKKLLPGDTFYFGKD